MPIFTIIAIVHIFYSTNFCERLCFTGRNGSVDSIVNKNVRMTRRKCSWTNLFSPQKCSWMFLNLRFNFLYEPWLLYTVMDVQNLRDGRTLPNFSSHDHFKTDKTKGKYPVHYFNCVSFYVKDKQQKKATIVHRVSSSVESGLTFTSSLSNSLMRKSSPSNVLPSIIFRENVVHLVCSEHCKHTFP